jgi:hypothetical protein
MTPLRLTDTQLHEFGALEGNSNRMASLNAVHTEKESVMPKTTKKKPISKAAAAALKAMENMVIKTADLDVHIEQVTERLKAAGLAMDIGSVLYAGRNGGLGQVVVNISSGGFGSLWPEWAYQVAEGALHFNKKVLLIYIDQPVGDNLGIVLCTNTPA